MQSVIQGGIILYPETIFLLAVTGLLENSSFSEGIFLFFSVSNVLLYVLGVYFYSLWVFSSPFSMA